MEKIRVRIKLLDELLGTASGNEEIHAEFIASKAPDAPSFAEEAKAEPGGVRCCAAKAKK